MAAVDEAVGNIGCPGQIQTLVTCVDGKICRTVFINVSVMRGRGLRRCRRGVEQRQRAEQQRSGSNHQAGGASEQAGNGQQQRQQTAAESSLIRGTHFS